MSVMEKNKEYGLVSGFDDCGAFEKLRNICEEKNIELITEAILQEHYILYLKERNLILVDKNTKESHIKEFIIKEFC